MPSEVRRGVAGTLIGLIISMLSWFLASLYADVGAAKSCSSNNKSRIESTVDNVGELRQDIREIRADIKELLRRTK